MQILAWLAVVRPETFFVLSIVCVYTFFCIFLYGVLCLRFGQGSCTIEMSIIIIIHSDVVKLREEAQSILSCAEPCKWVIEFLQRVFHKETPLNLFVVKIQCSVSKFQQQTKDLLLNQMQQMSINVISEVIYFLVIFVYIHSNVFGLMVIQQFVSIHMYKINT